jgi:hypothetical protein
MATAISHDLQTETAQTQHRPSRLRDRDALGHELLNTERWVVRYRGFVLIPQADLTWLVRPERSPMTLLPFRAPASSVDDVKALIDWRLNQAS